MQDKHLLCQLSTTKHAQILCQWMTFILGIQFSPRSSERASGIAIVVSCNQVEVGFQTVQGRRGRKVAVRRSFKVWKICCCCSCCCSCCCCRRKKGCCCRSCQRKKGRCCLSCQRRKGHSRCGVCCNSSDEIVSWLNFNFSVLVLVVCN